ncbi:MAG: DUF3820 family protein [Dysgonamonadaceae bacterium]|jgi:uncharacterized protein (DUF3820 family)|nr:DUF3820 family protein [Dysgonamonadaceae bacterium]
MKLTDESPMPWGIHKGKPMIDVPASYLIGLYKEDKAHGDVLEYINDNWIAIIQEEAWDLKNKRYDHSGRF